MGRSFMLVETYSHQVGTSPAFNATLCDSMCDGLVP